MSPLTLLMVLLSGDAPTLPAAEVIAVLEASSTPFRIVSQAGRLLRLEAPVAAAGHIFERCAYSHFVAEELFQSENDKADIITKTGSCAFKGLDASSSFSVRIKTIDGAVESAPIPELERVLGSIIKAKTGATVDLTTPKVVIYGVFAGPRFFCGRLLTRTGRGDISKRKPSSRPFFKPSSMSPLLARSLANLVRTRQHMIIVDPFCGTGGLLLESYYLGARIVAIELDTKTVAGAKKNLYRVGHVIKGDARHLPLRQVDGVLTDPPYGRSASTMGASLIDLLQSFLTECGILLSTGAIVCFAAPDRIPVETVVDPRVFELIETHIFFVHGSLTRKIYVFKRI